MPEDLNFQVSERGSTGPEVRAEYCTTTMTFYAVEEFQLESLSDDNDEARRFRHRATSLFGFAVGLFLQPWFMDATWKDLPSEVRLLVYVVCPLSILAGVWFFLESHKALTKRDSLLGRIKKRSTKQPIEFTIRASE